MLDPASFVRSNDRTELDPTCEYVRCMLLARWASRHQHFDSSTVAHGLWSLITDFPACSIPISGNRLALGMGRTDGDLGPHED